MKRKQYKFTSILLMFLILTVLQACSNRNASTEYQESTDDIIYSTSHNTEKMNSVTTTKILMLIRTNSKHGIAMDADTSTLYTLIDYQQMEPILVDLDNHALSINSLIPGTLIEISHSSTDSNISSDEMQKVTVLNHVSNLLPVYFNLITHITYQDTALNSDINCISLDLSQVLNLTENEKNTLCTLVTQNYRIPCKLATYEELGRQGELSEDGLSYQNGILISINITKDELDQFEFSITKWRSSFEALGYNSCFAYYKDCLWFYELEGGWIS